MDSYQLEMLKQFATATATQFGSNCEVVIHDLSDHNVQHSIVYIVNGHVSGRRVGDGPSSVVMEHLMNASKNPQDQLAYLTRTPDGKILKSSTLYIRNPRGRVNAILSINHDISGLMMAESAIQEVISVSNENEEKKPITIINVNELLDDLIDQSVSLVGKPAALMNKEDKITAIQFLRDRGAFLITKSSEKVAKFFGISKYTLYSYIDYKQEEKNHGKD